MKPAALLLSSSLALSFAAAAARGVSAGSAGQAKGVKPSDTFQAAAGLPPDAPSAFEFELNGFAYHIAANGHGRRTKGEKTRGFNLGLGSGQEVRRLFFSEHGGDLLLLGEVSGGEAAGVFVTMLEQPSMRSRWKQGAPSPSVETLRQGGSLYLAGSGFVARLDLRTGQYLWSHRVRPEEGEVGDAPDEEFIPPGRYGAPELSGGTATFRAAPGEARPRAVRVNRKSGKIVSVE